MKKTIRDIAAACGVSVGLVSRILNGDKTLKCKRETRDKVLLEIERSAFIPDPRARALANQSTRGKREISIGYVTYKGAVLKMNPYFDRVIEGIVSALTDMQCSVHCFYIDEVAECCRRKLPLGEKKLDGLILFGEIAEKKLIKYLAEQAKYLSSIYGEEIENADFVGSDILHSTDLILDYVYKCGYRSLGLITGGDEKRVKHILQHATELGLEIDENYTFNAGNESGKAYQMVAERLRYYPVPQLLCCMNDEMAIGAMKACLENGLKIPEDVAITGHDDIMKANYSPVPLTTVHIYKKEIGQLVTELLLERIKNKRKFPVKMLVPCELAVRDSVLKNLETRGGKDD